MNSPTLLTAVGVRAGRARTLIDGTRTPQLNHALGRRQMKWSAFLPRPIRGTLLVFGCANILGALASPWFGFSAEVVLPGVLIGLAFVLLGVKGGFPIVPTTTDPVGAGLRKIRQRQLAMYLSAGAYLVVAGPLLMSLPEKFRLTAFFLLALIPSGFFLTWAFSGCPRCGHHFLSRSGLRASRCQSCGLGLRDV